MRRLVAGTFAVGLVGTVMLAGLVAGALPASAQRPDHRLNREVTGSFVGTQVFDSSPACSFVRQVFDGTYEAERPGSRRVGTFRIDTCVDPAPDLRTFVYSGTFVLTTAQGAVLTGTVTGRTDAATPDSSLDLTLAVSTGTRSFKRVTGTIELSGIWSNEPPSSASGPTSGTLSGALER